ncbi:ABC transporter permease [Brevibacterium luteolum]|uniref:ABC transporter permease n=1 Tax=Brevibacterium luteolum TaxID=199591 RepID=UPI003B6720B4
MDRTIGVVSKIVLGVIVVVTLVPALLVIIVSFNPGAYVAFPPTGFSVEQYAKIFDGSTWVNAIQISILIGIACAVTSVVIALPTIYVASRSDWSGRYIGILLACVSILIPVSAYAVALYATLGSYKLLGSVLGVVLSHVLLALPIVVVLLLTGISKVPRDLDLVARTLGASRLNAAFSITLKLLLPSIFVSLIAAFLTSFDEAVFVSFLGGIGITTLPKAVLESVKFGLDPVITAIGGLLIIFNGVLVILRNAVDGRSARKLKKARIHDDG